MTPGRGRRIEDYALIGDTQSAALVGRNGSIDWACFPRFDSGACFAALLGNRDNGRWSVAPLSPSNEVRRRYRAGTMVLETEFETAGGRVRLIDFMPIRTGNPVIIRIVEGVAGTVELAIDLVVRFDTGQVTPWVRRCDDALVMTAGPDALCLRGSIEVHGEDLATVGHFRVRAGERRALTLTWWRQARLVHRTRRESAEAGSGSSASRCPLRRVATRPSSAPAAGSANDAGRRSTAG
jgi:hypothetical protein